MLRNPDRQATVLEVFLAGGLIAIGFATSQDFVLALAATAASMGSNWATSLAQSGFQHLRKRRLTAQGALNQDIITAAQCAFTNAVEELESKWKRDRYYCMLLQRDREAAQHTLKPFRWLREDATHLFNHPGCLDVALRELGTSLSWHAGETDYGSPLMKSLETYLYGFDEELLDFIEKHLISKWLLHYKKMVLSPDEQGTRAWRAQQLLWQTSAATALHQLEQQTTETLNAVSRLEEWVKRYEERSHDTTSEDALDRAFSQIVAELDKIRSSAERIEAHRGERKQGPVHSLTPPLPPYSLVGRADLLRELKEQLSKEKGTALIALHGLPGVGKTALAIALAHDPEVETIFPDGVLWAGLGRKAGKDSILSHLGRWATALGIPQNGIERVPDFFSWQQSIRAALEPRKMLLVIDDVWDVELAWQLKVGGPGCSYIITTRAPEVASRFSSAAATSTPELSEDDGLALLTQLVALENERDEARALVRAVGGLPLALKLMGNYLRVQVYSRQERRIRTALDKLQQAEERLKLAEPQGECGYHPSVSAGVFLSLQAVIEVSVEVLDETSRKTLRALSLFPSKPNSFSEEAALALPSTTVAVLDRIADTGLLESSGSARYSLHPTISDYASQQLIERADEQQSASASMVRYFVTYVMSRDRDVNTLEQEMPNVLSAFQTAFEYGWDCELVRGVNAFTYFLDARGLYTLAEEQLQRAQQATERLQSPLDTAATLHHLAYIAHGLGDYAKAETLTRASLDLAVQCGQRDLISLLLDNLNAIAAQRGEYNVAETYWQKELAYARQHEDDKQIMVLLLHLGILIDNRGNYEQADSYLQEALILARQIGDLKQTSDILMHLGLVALHLEYFAQAVIFLQEALTLARQSKDISVVIGSLEHLGLVTYFQGDQKQADGYLQEALTLARQIGNIERLSAVLASLGTVASLQKDYKQAEEYWQEGLVLARQMKHGERMSTILANLGSLASLRGDDEQAEVYWSEGLIISRNIGQGATTSNLLVILASLMYRRGDVRQAETYIREWLILPCKKVQNKTIVESLLVDLGLFALREGNAKQGEVYLQEALSIVRQSGQHERLCVPLLNLGAAALQQEEYERATEYLQEAVVIARQNGLAESVVGALGNLGVAAFLQGNVERAEDYLQEALSLAQKSEPSEQGTWLRSIIDTLTAKKRGQE